MDIEKLEQDIKYYAECYYQGHPVISDEQFDSLVDKLRELNPASSVLKTGWGFEVDGDKVKHKYTHIGSLEKCKNYNEIPDRFKNTKIYISPKLDGLSAVAYYEKGHLIKGITRGNGEYGKDITDKLKLIIGDVISDLSFTGAVRGELIINSLNWNTLSQKYDNLISPRNFAAGIINRKEMDEDIKYIDLVVYKIVGQDSTVKSFINRQQILAWLTHNFKNTIPEYYYPVLNEESWNMYHTQTFDTFKQIGYNLDGLVLTSNNVIYDSKHAYLYDEVAFKFPAETTVTTIENIEWNLSRTNRLIPVAIVKPVELSGAVINRATCNNAKWVQDMQICIGSDIEIQRSGEVIPKILTVIETNGNEVHLPQNCPICNESLEWNGVDLVCNNKHCPNIKLSDLEQWCEVIGETDGLQWTIMKQYLDMYGINSIESLYLRKGYVEEDLNTRQLSITDLKIKEFFKKLYKDEVSLYKLLMALNIPRLGDKTCKELSKYPDICKKLFIYVLNTSAFTSDDYRDIRCDIFNIVKDATTESIFQNLNKVENVKWILESSNTRVNFKQVATSPTKYVAVTGSLQTMKRKDFEKYIEQYGYELTSTLSKCEYLITNNPNSGSSKNKEARKYNVPIITEQQFLEVIK